MSPPVAGSVGIETPRAWTLESHTNGPEPLWYKPESWNMAIGGFVLGSLIVYVKGMRRMMFQLSGFYYKTSSANLIRTNRSSDGPHDTDPQK